MTVDLTKARPGMIAKFRCGGEWVISESIALGHGVSLKFVGSNVQFGFCGINGRYLHNDHTPFDIIELIDPPFDWKDVRPGMAFTIRPEFRSGTSSPIFRYISGTETRIAAFDSISYYDKDKIERCPDSDIKVS